MLNALLALTPQQLSIVAVCAVVGILLIGIAVAGLVRSKKNRTAQEKKSDKNSVAPQSADAVSAKESPAEAPAAQPAEANSEEVAVPVAQPSETESAEPVETPVSESVETPTAQPAEADSEEVAVPVAQPSETESAEPVETPVAEPVAESVEAPVAQPAEAASERSISEGTHTRIVYASEDGWFVNVRYDKSFEAKLIQGDEKLKEYYSQLKNELLSYRKVTARRSWQHEAFRRGRTTVAKLAIRGKTLRIYLALDPMLYEESKYLVEDASEHAKYAKTPLLYRIKNDRRCRYAKDLIAAAMASAEALRGEDGTEDYSSIPYESTDELIERGLVRIIEVRRRADGTGEVVLPDEDEEEEERPVSVAPRAVSALTVQEDHRVSVMDADELMADDEAEELVDLAERESDRRRQTIVNIDTLSEYFRDGERVGIEEMKERIPFFNKKATYVKVLARGVLNKTLEVEADDFSLDAVKMIALLGGKVYRTRK